MTNRLKIAGVTFDARSTRTQVAGAVASSRRHLNTVPESIRPDVRRVLTGSMKLLAIMDELGAETVSDI